jgi:hypothetical protein
MKCQCEHIAHFDRCKRTPNGNPGHNYEAEFTWTIEVKTDYGTFQVCKDCEEDCHQSKKKVKSFVTYPLREYSIRCNNCDYVGGRWVSNTYALNLGQIHMKDNPEHNVILITHEVRSIVIEERFIGGN